MRERIDLELELLRRHFTEVDHREQGCWVRVAPVLTGDGWSMNPVPVAFQIPSGFPATPPYGFYVPTGLAYRGAQPDGYQPLPSNQPPFEGDWAMFSWQHDAGWRPTADLVSGSNLLNWTKTFADRFAEGA